MAFNEVKWEFSNVEEKPVEAVEPGAQYFKILNASFDKETDVYKLTLQSLKNDGIATIRYFLTRKDSELRSFDNSKQVGTIISLGIALSGKRLGLPEPSSVIGGIVMAEVVYSEPNLQGKSYPNIYRFDAVSSELEPFSEIPQYYTDREPEQ